MTSTTAKPAEPQTTLTAVTASTKLISPTKILQSIVQKQLSGRLSVSDPKNESVVWRVYFGSGRVHFATSTISQKERLEYLLSRYCPSLASLALGEFKSDYSLICDYWQNGKLCLPHARKLLFFLTQEALVQMLALPKVMVHFEKTLGLDHILLSVYLKQLILPVRESILQWQQRRPEIISPFQRPTIKNLKQLPDLLWENVKDAKSVDALGKVLSQNLCLYEVANKLNTDVLALAGLLQPLIQAGAVEMNPYHRAETDLRPIVACIDDSTTVQRNVKLILEDRGFRVLGIVEPAKALSTLARYEPALVLMDINMPEINGYELSGMLRNSTQFQEIPILMLTGRDGMLDKLRARMVGAKGYIIKPFQPPQLLAKVRKHLYGDRTQHLQSSLNIGASQLAYT